MGMQEFRAASGRVVKPREDGSLMFEDLYGYLGAQAVYDAEEFFRAKRDEELGRWRWPENPDYVVYPVGQSARVFDERNGRSEWFGRGHGDSTWPPQRAARAYFEAHPVRRPWEDAQYGEVWAVTHTDGETVLCRVTSYRRFEQVSGVGSLVSMPVGHHSITAARRVRPGEAS